MQTDQESVVEFANYCVRTLSHDKMWLPQSDGDFAVEGQLKPIQEKFSVVSVSAFPTSRSLRY
jgi:hypothetical protein